MVYPLVGFPPLTLRRKRLAKYLCRSLNLDSLRQRAQSLTFFRNLTEALLSFTKLLQGMYGSHDYSENEVSKPL